MNILISLNWRYTDAKRTYATSSTGKSCSINNSPIWRLSTSASAVLRRDFSTSDTIISRVSTETGRFSHARISPRRILSRLNSSRLPSFLITISGVSSTISNVVNRRLHCSHSRRRRMDFASLAGRESSTLVPIKAQ
ncbi:hypothetical protein D3C75_1102260 [compost metagenome]